LPSVVTSHSILSGPGHALRLWMRTGLQTENVHLIGHFNVKQNIHSRTICNLDNVSLLHEMPGRTNRCWRMND
jgi:hypothetical protein